MKMKKSVIALAMVLGLGAGTAAVVSAHGWNGDGPGYGMMNGGGYGMMRGGYGMRGYNGRADVNDADYQKFAEQTAGLRKSIAVDRAELNALMAGDNPDAKRVRELTANIVDNQEKMGEIARTNDVGGGTGFPCNGPGYGRRN